MLPCVKAVFDAEIQMAATNPIISESFDLLDEILMVFL